MDLSNHITLWYQSPHGTWALSYRPHCSLRGSPNHITLWYHSPHGPWVSPTTLLFKSFPHSVWKGVRPPYGFYLKSSRSVCVFATFPPCSWTDLTTCLFLSRWIPSQQHRHGGHVLQQRQRQASEFWSKYIPTAPNTKAGTSIYDGGPKDRITERVGDKHASPLHHFHPVPTRDQTNLTGCGLSGNNGMMD